MDVGQHIEGEKIALESPAPDSEIVRHAKESFQIVSIERVADCTFNC